MRVAEVPEKPEHRWPAAVATLVAVLLYVFLPNNYELMPRWVLPALGALLVVPLVVLNPHHLNRETRWSRWMSIGIAVVLALTNQVAVIETIRQLLNGSAHAPTVLLATLQVWLTDVIAFGLIYWELDRRGPVARRLASAAEGSADFRFPQEDTGKRTPWRPAFFDYAYFSLSNMMAFSPTDVMPLSTRAKALMAVQALTGFVLLALVISRAVNILT